ncbi:CaiB/BaiF CoA transferase family protein [Psychroflexus aestuariivivens]|uniref:CaiB/BaiF CoA transferase family protein n=1 Tax=Psychroflexus aestuariivivens TaxID=1795040 RepID=UPI000FD9ACA8|nr:CoA transferase [Psychroflexus aestuariivivens]
MTNNSLSNLKIIDLSTVLAGPSVGSFFAELGAEVIKIEHPKHKDVTRSWKLPSESKTSSVSAYFSSVNYKKQYRFLDLTQPKDYQEFLEILQEIDVVLMNFKTSSQVKLKITDEELWKVNPALLIGKISGYGQDSSRVAYDLILQADTGFMSMNGTPDSGSVKMPVALIDVMAAHQLKEGILLALLEQSRQGQKHGQVIHVSLYDAAVSALANQASNYLMEEHIPQRQGSLHPNIAPYGEIFETKDQQSITFAIGSDLHFEKLVDYLGLLNLSEDERFNSTQNRVVNRNELEKLLRAKIKNFTAEKILTDMENLAVPCAKIKNLQDVFESKQAKKMIREEQIEGKSSLRVSQIAFEIYSIFKK